MAKITYVHEDPDMPDVENFDAAHVQEALALRGYTPKVERKRSRRVEAIEPESTTDIGDASPEHEE